MKLLEPVRAKMRLLHYSWDTEECYVRWIERYILFHKQGTVRADGPADVRNGHADHGVLSAASERCATRQSQGWVTAHGHFEYNRDCKDEQFHSAP